MLDRRGHASGRALAGCPSLSRQKKVEPAHRLIYPDFRFATVMLNQPPYRSLTRGKFLALNELNFSKLNLWIGIEARNNATPSGVWVWLNTSCYNNATLSGVWIWLNTSWYNNTIPSEVWIWLNTSWYNNTIPSEVWIWLNTSWYIPHYKQLGKT